MDKKTAYCCLNCRESANCCGACGECPACCAECGDTSNCIGSAFFDGVGFFSQVNISFSGYSENWEIQYFLNGTKSWNGNVAVDYSEYNENSEKYTNRGFATSTKSRFASQASLNGQFDFSIIVPGGCGNPPVGGCQTAPGGGQYFMKGRAVCGDRTYCTFPSSFEPDPNQECYGWDFSFNRCLDSAPLVFGQCEEPPAKSSVSFSNPIKLYNYKGEVVGLEAFEYPPSYDPCYAIAQVGAPGCHFFAT
jgi:hypothetical protein